MQRAHKLLALVAVSVVAGSGTAVAAGTTGGASERPVATTPTATTTTQPTPQQIATAMSRAEKSKQLWSTFNSCDYRGQDEVGIRGQMPSLPFDSRLLMVVSLQQWSPTLAKYVPVKGSYKLGGKIVAPDATIQDGVTLRFTANLTLIGHITFEWFLDGKLLGSTVRVTSAGHRDDAGTPENYSVETCST